MGSRTRMLTGLGLAVLSCGVAYSAHGLNGSRPNRDRPSNSHASFGHIQGTPQFSSDDKSKIMGFWSDPNRYSVTKPTNAVSRGLWQVRLTAEGSQWLWNLGKGKKTATSLMGGSTIPNTDGGAWNAWILKKVRHDRWAALMEARADNARDGFSSALPAADRETPDQEPESPGPIPDSLLAENGQPPLFAAAVQPKQYKVAFENGTYSYEDNVRLSNSRYAYFRFPEGVMSSGVALRNFDANRLDRILSLAGCDASRSKVLRAVSQLEGGFGAVNTYDTGYVSVGFIQFASLKDGSGSLGAMLQLYKITDPTDFDNDFRKYGIEVQSDGTLDVIDPATGTEYFGADANTKIIQDKRLIAVFQHAGETSDAFCSTQVKAALSQYSPSEDHLAFTTSDGTTLCGKVGDVIRSEAGMATLFDRKVNTGNIRDLTRISNFIATQHHCQSLSDLARYEKEIVNGMRYRLDFTNDLTLSQPSGSR